MIVSNVSLHCAHCFATAAAEEHHQQPHLSSSSLSPTGHLVVAVCLGCIGTVAFLTNFLVLTLFCRYRALRTPMNLLLVSISFSDLLVSVLGTPFSFAASVHGRWLIGRAGCVWYGFVNACLGIVSLISLAVLSYERYNTIMATTMADGTDFRAVLGGIGFSWLYAVRYGPEGPGTTCSVDWKTQTVNNVSYIVCLFVFCLILPFCVILYSYGKLLRAIRQVSRMSSIVPRRREQRVLLMVVTMVVCYLVCWLPYGVAALLSAFGPRDLLTPTASITPSLLAKCSTAINPFIYVFMNKQFYRCFRAFISCSPVGRGGSGLKSFSRATRTIRTTRQERAHPAVSLSIREDSSKRHRHHSHSPCPSPHKPASPNPPKVILVAHYKE
uniref:Teleost multiple tissue opsin b n=1 Tax=Neogobius melanostomus TaxID=47308 RepID=A0A8C6UIR7_9GOBI